MNKSHFLKCGSGGMLMQSFVLNCFCTDLKNSGNPAVVIRDFIGDDVTKLAYAKQLNQPVIVYINHQINNPKLEFFYPDAKMSLCLHGTLAAAAILLNDSNKDDIVLFTDNDLFNVKRIKDDCMQIKVSASLAKPITLHKNAIAQMLNINSSLFDNDMPLTVASVGSPKLLVPITSLHEHKNLHPNFEVIKEWSIENNINGIYTYTPTSTKHNFFARGFNPKTGHNEDAATGVAAAALASVLGKSIVIEQGAALNRHCSIVVTYENSHSIWVGGKVNVQ